MPSEPLPAGCGMVAVGSRVQEVARSLARLPWPLTLTGPTGAGKTYLARQIHLWSERRGAFVECPLPAIPLSLRHSIFSGHLRGSYTDAREDRAGLIEQARDGTLFLDEIGLAHADVQEQLLGHIGSPVVTRLGEARPRPVNVRFLFATNSALAALRERGEFREDLFWRLGPFTIRVPGLAERREDILGLAEAFLREALWELEKPWAPVFGRATAECLRDHGWPGNLRELRDCCRWIAWKVEEDRPVELADLPPGVVGTDFQVEESNAVRRRDAVLAALRKNQGNVSRAARELGVSRGTVYRQSRRQRASGQEPGRCPE